MTRADVLVALANLAEVWVCLACGKLSRTQTGFDRQAIHYGWDSSCFSHAVRVRTARLILDERGRVLEVPFGSLVEDAPL
jgi:hypothetical protein